MEPFALTFAQRRSFRRRLLGWFRAHQRCLPWRSRRTPYRVWISELMLQQTRVDQALPYYRRFMRRFPSLKALAAAPLQDVLKHWEGLGYYARARNLHQAARGLVRENKGRFPRTYADLLSLPGIGSYTAAAVASLAFNEPVAVVDGNVIRVLSRYFAWKEPAQTTRSKKQFQAWADCLLDAEAPGAFNEALMELGALVCLPRNPDCPACPLRRTCRVRTQQARPETFPVKRKKPPVPRVEVCAGVVRDSRGRLLIARRKEQGLLGGLWEFPGGKMREGESRSDCLVRELQEELGITVQVGEPLMTVHHAYSHFKLKMYVFEARLHRGRPRVIDCADFTWCREADLDDYPFSRADLHVVDRLVKGG